MMAGVCAGVGPRGVHVRTGVMGTSLGGGLSGMCAAGIMDTLGTPGEGAGQSGWNKTAGEGRGALRAGDVGGLAVTLEKMLESVWMEAN